MTNYFHNLRAGHFAYFLHKRGNLYRYSQQDWENVNGKMKRNFNNNTQRGGGKGGSSKLLPIFFTFCRGLLWRCGILDAFFDEVDPGSAKGVINMKYGKTPDYFYETKIDNDVIEGFAKTLLDMGSSEDILGNLDSL